MERSDRGLAIGAVSKWTGCKVETIRYYERIGLLPAPARTEGGYRIYGVEGLKRLNFIRRARQLGFGLKEVRTLLRLADKRTRPSAAARRVAARYREEVRAKVADLRATERVLTEMIARCAGGRLPACPLIETLFREPGPWPQSPGRRVSRSSASARGRR